MIFFNFLDNSNPVQGDFDETEEFILGMPYQRVLGLAEPAIAEIKPRVELICANLLEYVEFQDENERLPELLHKLTVAEKMKERVEEFHPEYADRLDDWIFATKSRLKIS